MIGNCTISALVDEHATIVWCCMPRFDSVPVFDALINSEHGTPAEGAMSLQIENFVRVEQAYDAGTAIVRTRLFDSSGNGIEAVSYTHLDVYKRQVQQRAQPPRAPVDFRTVRASILVFKVAQSRAQISDKRRQLRRRN